MRSLRHWSVRHAGLLERSYQILKAILLGLNPVFSRFGYERFESSVVLLESSFKGALFDCKMCGDCVLDSSGMSCPMNCPKEIRNGPCGGVRSNGNCEIKPDMLCVWVAAFEGSQRMREKNKIINVVTPLDHRLAGGSSWLLDLRKQVRARSRSSE